MSVWEVVLASFVPPSAVLIGSLLTRSVRFEGAVPVLVAGLVDTRLALALLREADVDVKTLAIAKVALNSVPYLASSVATCLAFLGPEVGGAVAVVLATVDCLETGVGFVLLRGVRIEGFGGGSGIPWRAVLRAWAAGLGGVVSGLVVARLAPGFSGALSALYLVNPVAGCAAVGSALHSGALSPVGAYWAAVIGTAVGHLGRFVRGCGLTTGGILGFGKGIPLAALNSIVDAGLTLAVGALVGVVMW